MVPYCYYLRYENLDMLNFDYAYLAGVYVWYNISNPTLGTSMLWSFLKLY